jgi:acyl-CoA synthetase (AMP-forming)/AMP-acid ligase II
MNSSPTSEVLNIASLIDDICLQNPDHIAISAILKSSFNHSHWEHLTFGDLQRKSDELAAKLVRLGFTRGMRVLLFVRPSLDFPIIACALFKIGVVLVLIDPGMGRKNLLRAIADVEPEGLIAVSEVFLGKFFFSKKFSSVKISVIVKDRFSFGHFLSGPAVDFHKLMKSSSVGLPPWQAIKPRHEELCGILFTSGGTGIPKGVMYSHAMFIRQVELIRELYGVGKSDIDMPCFPLFALFSLALGARVIVPDLDPTKPALVDPRKIISAIQEFQVTFAGGSPAIWERVGNYAHDHGIKLPSMRSLLMFGAPVRYHIHELFREVLSGGTTYTPYGATECLPVANISGKEILNGLMTRASEGTCVGQPAPGLQVKIIESSLEPIVSMQQVRELKSGQIGEIICKGSQVTKAYFKRPEATVRAKIYEAHDVWHRMGDLGWMDESGRLWFCGRQVHSFSFEGQIYYSIRTEAPFNLHPGIKRTALIRLGNDSEYRPALAIERKDHRTHLSASERQLFLNDLQKIARSSTESRAIKDFFLVKEFPVDVRHNIKIDRILLGKAISQSGKGRIS